MPDVGPLPSRDWDALLTEAYAKQTMPIEFLAYTPQFEEIYSIMQGHGDPRSRAEIWTRLMVLKKGGYLPRVRAAT